jgi:hypothetical protein
MVQGKRPHINLPLNVVKHMDWQDKENIMITVDKNSDRIYLERLK